MQRKPDPCLAILVKAADFPRVDGRRACARVDLGLDADALEVGQINPFAPPDRELGFSNRAYGLVSQPTLEHDVFEDDIANRQRSGQG